MKNKCVIGLSALYFAAILWGSAQAQTISASLWKQLVRVHSGTVRALSFSSDGNILASRDGQGTIKLWSTETGREHRTLRSNNMWSDLSLSPDGNILAGTGYHCIKLWSIETGREIREIKHLYAHFVTFSPDGKVLASVDDDGDIIIWSVATWREFRTFSLKGTGVTCICFSPDGKVLVSGHHYRYNQAGKTEIIKIWSVSTGKELKTISVDKDDILSGVYSVSLSPDGELLASGDIKKINIWSLKTGKKLRTLLGFSHSVLSVSFSPDGKLLMGIDQLSNLKFWSVETWRELNIIPRNIVFSFALSPDGKWLAFGYNDAIEIWKLEGVGSSVIATVPKPKYPAQLSVTLSFFEPSGNGFLDAEEVGKLIITLINKGRGDAYRLQVKVTTQTSISGVQIGRLSPIEHRFSQYV